MEFSNLKPRVGNDTYRIGDSDDVVIMENIGSIPVGRVRLKEHGVIFICTSGEARLDYDGKVIQIKKNDLFIYIAKSIATNFMATPDFNCRQLWLTRGELSNINLYSEASLVDLLQFKQHPVVHLSDDDMDLLDSYFQLLLRKMKTPSVFLFADIVRSLIGTMLKEMLSMLHRSIEIPDVQKGEDANIPGAHKKQLVDKFLLLVEQNEGRSRRVDEYASQLNITPKYLSIVIKEILNRRPTDCIQFFTMKAIENRLRFSDMTMQQIAIDLNFPNASFFGKYFKEHSGMTPLEFRKKYLGGGIIYEDEKDTIPVDSCADEQFCICSDRQCLCSQKESGRSAQWRWC